MATNIDDTTPLLCIIETAQASGDHIEYEIKVQRGHKIEDSWIISRRYSDFVTLDTGLKVSAMCPTLPPKKVFGNTNREFILERQQKLQAYLDQILADQLLANAVQTKRFLHDNLYQNNFQEIALQHISMFLRSEPDWQVSEPLPDLGCRIQKGYFLVKNLKSPKERYLLSWCPFGLYTYIEEKERMALVKQLSTLQHPYLQSILLSSASKAGAIVIRPYCSKGSLADIITKTKPKVHYLKKYGNPKSVSPISLNEIRVIGRQVLELMSYMHDKNFPLGHIHAGNLLVDLSGMIKVTDIENFILGVPSRFRTFTTNIKKISTLDSLDSYSFGFLIYELFTGRQLRTATLQQPPPGCPHELGEILMRLLGEESLKSGIPTVEELMTSVGLFSDVNLPAIDKPVVKIPSKLKEHVKASKLKYEEGLKEEQRMIGQIKKRNKLRDHHMSEEERRKRRSKKQSLARIESEGNMSDKSVSSAAQNKSNSGSPATTRVAPPAPASGVPTAPVAPAPPPAPGPPPPAPAAVPQAVKNPDSTRGALLSSISGFSKGGLKKAVTVDKSGPKI